MTTIETTERRAAARKTDERIVLTDLEYNGKLGGPWYARVSITDNSKSNSSSALVKSGGPFHAIATAIRNMVPHDGKQINYSVHSITQGSDACAEVTVGLQNHKGEYEGKGVDIDTVIASARAHVQALNRLLAF